MHVIRAFSLTALKRLQHFTRGFSHLHVVNRRRAGLLSVFRRRQTRAPTENE